MSDSKQPNNGYDKIVGQESAIARLRAFTNLFESSGGTPGHILLIGDPGMGQGSIARAVASELGVKIGITNAALLGPLGDLTAILTNVQKRQILLLSDIQMLRRPLIEKLQGVLRELKLTITIGQGARARDHTMDLLPFTLVATCPRRADCPSELLGEFSLILTLQPYSRTELNVLATKIAMAAWITLEPRAAELVAGCSDGRPSSVATILRRLARAVNKTFITEEDALRAFSAFGMSVQSNVPSERLSEIGNLSGVDFEILIMGMLTRMGFQAEMTRATGDGGIDIVASLDKPIVGGRYLFQCKRFSPDNLVGAPTVGDFYGAVTADRAMKGVLITTSDFTAQAREFGEKAGLELIGLRQLERLLLEYGVHQPRDQNLDPQ